MVVQHSKVVVVHRGSCEAVEHCGAVLRGNVEQFAEAVGELTHDDKAIGVSTVANRAGESLVVR
jgi:hypothetical protein